jgi:hypothetical protein
MDINHPTLQSLAISYEIPISVDSIFFLSTIPARLTRSRCTSRYTTATTKYYQTTSKTQTKNKTLRSHKGIRYNAIDKFLSGSY